ncbi:MAG: cell division protein FtsA, partial [Dehalococcoidia bacterium]
METHVIVGNISRIQNLLKSVEEAGIKVKGLVLEPLASSEAVLTKEEMQSGIVLADIGGGSTDVASFKDGSIWQTTVLAVAGNHITNDIATCLDTPFRSAENLKVQYGHALPEAVDPNEELEIESFSDRNVRRIKRRELCEIIRARVQETLLIIGQRIKQGGGLNAFPPYGLVITGGTASLPGIAELAQKILHTSVRVGIPMGIPGLDSSLSNPAFATSMGILLWKLTHEDAEQKMDQMGFRNYFNQFNEQVLSRMKQPQTISPMNLKKSTKPQVIRAT